jgi:uncharacterized protein involved in exopolysaccharide biosynthesis
MIGVQEDAGGDPMAMYYRRYFGLDANEEIQILKSRGLAEKVIGRLDLLNNPEFNPSLRVKEESAFDLLRYLNPLTWIPPSWKQTLRGASSGELVAVQPTDEERDRRVVVRAVNIFLSKLNVAPVERSDIINITFSSTSPRTAERVANAIPEVFILDKLEAKLEATERVTGWLSEQLAELEQKVRDSEQAVELYRIEKGITEVAGGGDLITQQLSSINSQLIIAKAERAEAEARLAQVNRLLDSDQSALETSVEVLTSPIVQQLRAQESEIMRRISELSVEYGPKHPRMLQVQAEVEDVRQRITEAIRNIVVGLENEVEVARTRERSLEESLREVEMQTGAQNREAIQLRALEREAAANRALHETFLSRFKETDAREGTETPDARVLSKAELPTSPSAPNRRQTLLIIVMLGFAGACGLVFALHLLNPGMFSPEQVEAELGVHVIGLLPKLPGKEAPHQHVRDKKNSGFVEAINSLKISLKLSGGHQLAEDFPEVVRSGPEDQGDPGHFLGARGGQDLPGAGSRSGAGQERREGGDRRRRSASLVHREEAGARCGRPRADGFCDRGERRSRAFLAPSRGNRPGLRAHRGRQVRERQRPVRLAAYGAHRGPAQGALRLRADRRPAGDGRGRCAGHRPPCRQDRIRGALGQDAQEGGTCRARAAA